MEVRGGGGRYWAVVAAGMVALMPVCVGAQDTAAVRVLNDSVALRFVDVDLRALIQALGRYLSKPVIVGNFQPIRVSLETPGRVDRATLVRLLKGVVETQNLEFTEDSSFFRISQPVAAQSRAGPPGGPGQGRDTAAVQIGRAHV